MTKWATAMNSDEPRGWRDQPGWNLLALILASIALIFVAGVGAGITAAYFEENNGVTFSIVAVWVAVAVILIGGVWWMMRRGQSIASTNRALPRRERAYNRYILISMVLGGLLGAASVIAMEAFGIQGADVFSSAPVPAAYAMISSAIILIVMVPLSLHYHRSVMDEQERDAYRYGAVGAGYFMVIAAPIWWMLARGGLLPEITGPALYFAFLTVWMLGWAWRKFR